MIDAVDPVTPGGTSSSTDLLGLIPGPIAAFLAVLLVLMPIVTEVKGWTHGPLHKRVTRAAEAAERARADAEAARADRDERWRDRDRRVEELEAVVELMKERLDRQGEELDVLHRQGDAQNRLLASHTDWDRRAQSEVNRLGGNLPAPPPLYVYDTEETP